MTTRALTERQLDEEEKRILKDAVQLLGRFQEQNRAVSRARAASPECLR